MKDTNFKMTKAFGSTELAHNLGTQNFERMTAGATQHSGDAAYLL